MWRRAAVSRFLVLAAIAVAAAGIWRFAYREHVASAPHPLSRQARTASRRAPQPAPPEITLDGLRLRTVGVIDRDRDPFTFQQRASVALDRPPIPAVARAAVAVVPAQVPVAPAVPVPPIKFMGSLHWRGETWAIFADCAGYTGAARRGESFLGEWEVSRIGVESVLVGRHGAEPARLPMAGCAPR